jgi:hypothetical protein
MGRGTGQPVTNGFLKFVWLPTFERPLGPAQSRWSLDASPVDAAGVPSSP